MILSTIGLIGAVVSPAIGQVYYKLFFQSKNRLHLIAAIFFFGLSSFWAYIALKQISIGVVNMSTALTQLLIIILARYWLREQINHDHLIAIVLIMFGVVIYAS